MNSQPMKFKRDVHLRQQVFDPRSFEHDGRLNLWLLQYLVDTYTKPGDTLLDPMGGTGSLYLAASTGNRRVICGEIETWLRPILESNRRRGGAWRPLLGLTSPTLAYQGDAAAIPLAAASVDHINTSPPYADTFSDWQISSNRMKRNHVGPHGSAYGDDRGNKVKTNIGNIHIYEDFLRAMHRCFLEYRRVLKPEGTLALIVKDRIKGGQRLPIVDDLVLILRAVGFIQERVIDRKTQLSQYRQLHKKQGRPVIDDEQAVIFRAPQPRPADFPHRPLEWSLVMVPEAGGPPSLVYQKALAAARGLVFCFVPGHPLYKPAEAPRLAPDVYARSRFKMRVATAYDVVEQLVRLGLRAGDRVVLHVAWRYGEYLQRRLTTLGALVEAPTRGLNMGQKLTYYTRRGTA